MNGGGSSSANADTRIKDLLRGDLGKPRNHHERTESSSKNKKYPSLNQSSGQKSNSAVGGLGMKSNGEKSAASQDSPKNGNLNRRFSLRVKLLQLL